MSKVTKEQYIKDLEHDMGKLADIVIDLKDKLKLADEYIDNLEGATDGQQKRNVTLTMENAELKDRLRELGDCDDIVENRGEKFSVSEILGKKVDENQSNLFEDK